MLMSGAEGPLSLNNGGQVARLRCGNRLSNLSGVETLSTVRLETDGSRAQGPSSVRSNAMITFPFTTSCDENGLAIDDCFECFVRHLNLVPGFEVALSQQACVSIDN